MIFQIGMNGKVYNMGSMIKIEKNGMSFEVLEEGDEFLGKINGDVVVRGNDYQMVRDVMVTAVTDAYDRKENN